MKRLTIPCNPANCGGPRREPVEWIVVHYTAGRNDTAENNGIYFARESVGASAHWFVDEDTAVLSVPEDQVAWHCGGGNHPHCRNGNSIGVEICTKWENGDYAFAPAAVEHAAALIRERMEHWARPTVRKLVERQVLQGDGTGLNLSGDLLRTLVILDRLGLLDRE